MNDRFHACMKNLRKLKGKAEIIGCFNMFYSHVDTIANRNDKLYNRYHSR